MTVNLNNMRKQAAYSLDKVIKTLNDGIMQGKEFSLTTIEDKDKWFEGNLLVSTDALESDIEQLRACIWTMLCMYEENNPDFKDLSDEIFENGGIAHFNNKQS
ncbi:MAG: hypothetical protein LBJ63_07680 [Prevotellaceae bacterium]|jgi:hypothetical protein|nr:hypothetical protein [Prevotellaceae bacterium]